MNARCAGVAREVSQTYCRPQEKPGAASRPSWVGADVWSLVMKIHWFSKRKLLGVQFIYLCPVLWIEGYTPRSSLNRFLERSQLWNPEIPTLNSLRWGAGEGGQGAGTAQWSVSSPKPSPPRKPSLYSRYKNAITLVRDGVASFYRLSYHAPSERIHMDIW